MVHGWRQVDRDGISFGVWNNQKSCTVHIGGSVPRIKLTANVSRSAWKFSVYLVYFLEFHEALGPSSLMRSFGDT
jgi:hypothetical protein